MNARLVTGSRVLAVLVAALLTGACRKAPPKVEHESAATPDAGAAAVDAPLHTATVLRGTTWAGHIGTAAVELSAKAGPGASSTSSKGELVFFQFGRPILHEDMDIDVDAKGRLHLRGTKVTVTTRVAYTTDPDEYTACLSADEKALVECSGATADAAPWTLAAGASGQALSAPLDVAKLEHLLETGKWVGWLVRGQERSPLRMAITRKGTTLVATLTNGASSWRAPVVVGRDGTFKLEPASHTTARGVEREVFVADVREDLAVIEGARWSSVTQGFISESNAEHMVLINQKVLPPPARHAAK
jgi:hypothetical protein